MLINNSIPLAEPIELINIVPYNPLISKCQIKVCWVGDEPNPNKSIITKKVALEMANSIPGSPIVGYYNEDTEDFEGHNKIIEVKDGKFFLKPTTQPYGFVDLAAKVWFQKFSDNGVVREYLVTEGWLWTGQFPECQRVLSQGNGQSMELDEGHTDAYWTKDINGKNQFFIINETIISKLCLLGETVAPAFEGASVTAPKMEFSFDEDFKTKMFSMMEELKTIIKEGGSNKMENNEPILENAAAKEEEICPECGKPVSECVCGKEDGEKKPEENACGDKKKEFSGEEAPVVAEEAPAVVEEAPIVEETPVDEPVKYNLEEIPEYIELKEKFDTLTNDYNSMKLNYEAIQTSNAELLAFKAKIEKAEKQAMINNFYMLSEADKQDVVDHIDEYSLEEIEAKLSIACVRNRVSFNTESENKTSEPIVYNLNTESTSSVDAPAWLASAISVSKNK